MNSQMERTYQDIVRLSYAGLDSTALRHEVLRVMKRVMKRIILIDAAFFATTDPATVLFTSAIADEILLRQTPLFLQNEFLQDDTNKFVDQVPGIVDSLREKLHNITGASSSDIGARVQHFFQRYTDHPEKLIGPITSIGLTVAGVLGAFILMLITSFYIAVRPQPLIDGALRLFPPAERGRVVEHRVHLGRARLAPRAGRGEAVR